MRASPIDRAVAEFDRPQVIFRVEPVAFLSEKGFEVKIVLVLSILAIRILESDVALMIRQSLLSLQVDLHTKTIACPRVRLLSLESFELQASQGGANIVQ